MQNIYLSILQQFGPKHNEDSGYVNILTPNHGGKRTQIPVVLKGINECSVHIVI